MPSSGSAVTEVTVTANRERELKNLLSRRSGRSGWPIWRRESFWTGVLLLWSIFVPCQCDWSRAVDNTRWQHSRGALLIGIQSASVDKCLQTGS